MGRRSNKFKKAIHHLKSKQIDEKLEMLNEIPTNNTAGIYIVEPDYMTQDPDIPGDVTREANFTQDALVNGRDTTGLFDTDGTTILTIEPPGDTSYILGPMASMWYAWGNFSTIGYIRQSDRRMVDLGRITGQLEDWNGSSGFTSYGQLTLPQADWFRTTPKYENYRAFYPGPPSNAPDQYGRYYCVITGTTKSTTKTPPPRRVPPVLGPFDPNLPPGSANPNRRRTDYEIAGSLPYVQDNAPRIPLKLSPRGPYTPIKDYGGWYGPSGPSRDPWDGRGPLGPIPGASKGRSRGPMVASYHPQGQVLTESRKKIIKDLKKSYQLPEEKKEKIKHRPRIIGSEPRSINVDLMKKAEVPTSFKQPEERLWTRYNKMENARWSQERKNEILDHLGGSDHAWEWLTETSKQKNKDIMYGHFGGEKKSSVVRKEDVKGDKLLFIVDENGNKESILQSELSIQLADEFNKELFGKYFQEQETLQADKDPLFKRVSNKIKPVIDYPDKPSKHGYPDQPPAETINGWNPEYGQKADYYNKLDSHSADSMPPTGNPEIDAKVQRAKILKRVLGKKA